MSVKKPDNEISSSLFPNPSFAYGVVWPLKNRSTVKRYEEFTDDIGEILIQESSSRSKNSNKPKSGQEQEHEMERLPEQNDEFKKFQKEIKRISIQDQTNGKPQRISLLSNNKEDASPEIDKILKTDENGLDDSAE